MEFRRQEMEKVYNPTPLQQAAFTMPLPSSATSLHYVPEAREGAGEARDGMGPLIQKPTPISSPAMAGAMGGGGGGGGGGSRSHFSTTAAIAVTEADTALRYRECLRNHAASLGGHILDGCCEFMPCSDDALRCAACGCHRSFHRKDTDMNSPLPDVHNGTRGRVPLLLPLTHLPPPPVPHDHNLKPFGSGGVLLHTWNNAGASAGAVTESSSEEIMAGPPPQFIVSRKRFRTKFTGEQKERMMAFAEKIGWRMQKQEDAAVEQFCGEVGVSRQVLKVWMHNNKNSTTRKQQQQPEEEEEEQHHHHEMPED